MQAFFKCRRAIAGKSNLVISFERAARRGLTTAIRRHSGNDNRVHADVLQQSVQSGIVKRVIFMLDDMKLVLQRRREVWKEFEAVGALEQHSFFPQRRILIQHEAAVGRAAVNTDPDYRYAEVSAFRNQLCETGNDSAAHRHLKHGARFKKGILHIDYEQGRSFPIYSEKNLSCQCCLTRLAHLPDLPILSTAEHSI